MDELDMSRPGGELFPETAMPYNSYQDVNMGQVVDDPLNTGAKVDVADQQVSDKEMNFRALRDEVSKMKEEREYWKGQAEAYSRQPVASKEDAFNALEWDNATDVKKAFDALRQENVKLRDEMRDALTAVETKAKRQDWNTMVTQHVPQLTSKNPIFAEMIQNASNPYEAAYLLAELNAKASQTPVSQTVNQGYGQRAIANASKPLTLNSVGGNSQLGAADYYASMSDDDFMKVASRNLANI